MWCTYQAIEISKGLLTSEEAEKVINNTFLRISGALTEPDMEYIEKISEKDTDGALVEKYIKSKLPNYDLILEEKTKKILESK